MRRGVLILCLMFAAIPVHAAITITKVMYDPVGSNAGHQWIEVSNTGPEAIDLGAKAIRLFDTSGNHLIKPYKGTDAILPSGGAAVIAQNPLLYSSDHPDYTGMLLKSSFSLPAAAGSVGIVHTAPPAPIKVKQIASSKSTNNGKRSRTTTNAVTSPTYGKGTVAPATSADAAVAGALPAFSFPSFSIPMLAQFEPLFSSIWFAGFLGLLAFSGFSLILIQRRTHL